MYNVHVMKSAQSQKTPNCGHLELYPVEIRGVSSGDDHRLHVRPSACHQGGLLEVARQPEVGG